MTARTWPGIGVGTLIVSLGTWFAILSLPTSVSISLLIFSVAIVMAAYAMAGFSGAEDPAGTGFKAALYAFIAGGAMFGMFLATDNDPYVVISPVVAIGVCGTYGLAPTGPLLRRGMRLVSLVIVGVMVWLLFTVDPTVYGLIVPLLPLVAVGFADRVFDRAVAVVEEEPLGGADETSA